MSPCIRLAGELELLTRRGRRVETAMQVLHLLRKIGEWPLHHQVRNNLSDWQRTHGRLWNTQLSQPSS